MSDDTLLTELMLLIFQVNGQLLEKGNELIVPLGLTSARWQVMGAIAMAKYPLSCPQIASAMGITRQGAQKQLNLAQIDKLINVLPNPRHERSPLYVLSAKGTSLYEKIMLFHTAWTEKLVPHLPPEKLEIALEMLKKLNSLLQSTDLPCRSNNHD